MAVYSIHMPQNGAAADAVFVRQGFCVPAFVFGALWLVARGLWLAAAITIAVVAAAAALGASGVIPAGAALALAGLVHLFLGVEAGRLVERRLARRGCDLAAILTADGAEAAESAFFGGLDGGLRPAASVAARRAPAAQGAGPLGVMPRPDRLGGGAR